MNKKRTIIAWGLFLLTPILLHPTYLRAQTTSWGSGSGGSVTPSGVTAATTCVDSGANDTYTCTMTGVASYADILGVSLGVRFNTQNTGAATLNINGIGAQAIVKPANTNPSQALATGDIVATSWGIVQWDGTNFQLKSTPNNTFFGTGSNSQSAGTLAIAAAATLTVNGSLTLDKTLTAGGTTGAQTINKRMGSVNFAAAATTLVVTNSTALTTSVILLTPMTADTTCTSFSAVRAAGSFTITANAGCNAETVVGFLVLN